MKTTPIFDGMSDQEVARKQDQLILKAHSAALEKAEVWKKKIGKLEGQHYGTEENCKQAWKRIADGSAIEKFAQLFVNEGHYVSNLEVVRYFSPERRTEESSFGRGWHLLIPYQLKRHGWESVVFQGNKIPKAMLVKNLVTGDEEVLVFSTTRYTVAGYVPEVKAGSEWAGLFLLADGSYQLIDGVGSAFVFDQAGHLTEMVFSEDYRIGIEYADEPIDVFADIPYVVRAKGNKTITHYGSVLPKQMQVIDVARKTVEDFVFSGEHDIALYIPIDGDQSRYELLAPLTDGSHRLLDKRGNEVVFSVEGVFRSLIPGDEKRIVRSIASGGHEARFVYTIGSEGQVLIAGAGLKHRDKNKPAYAVSYKYDSADRLYSAAHSSP